MDVVRGVEDAIVIWKGGVELVVVVVDDCELRFAWERTSMGPLTSRVLKWVKSGRRMETGRWVWGKGDDEEVVLVRLDML